MIGLITRNSQGGVRPHLVAGWSSPVARQAHNLKVVGSNPTPATNFKTVLIMFALMLTGVMLPP